MKAHIKIEFDLNPVEYQGLELTEEGVKDLVRHMIYGKADWPAFVVAQGISVTLSGCPNDTDGDDRCGREDCPHCRPKEKESEEDPDTTGINPYEVQKAPPVPICPTCQRNYTGVPDDGDDHDEAGELHEFKQKCQGLVKKWREEAAERGPVTRQTWRGAAAELEKAILERDGSEVKNPHGFL